MITWIILVIVLAIFQLLCLTVGFPDTYSYFASILLLLSALGMLYRIYRKQRAGEREKMQKEIEALRQTVETSEDVPQVDVEVNEGKN